jgi:uncharacterized protein (DUF2235 family)
MTTQTASQSWRSTYSAARAGRLYPDQPMAHIAMSVLSDSHKSAARARDRWLSSSIPQIAASSRSRMTPVDVARWLVPSRCALYALSAARRTI